ncbi:hypothetical protein OKW34_008788 [Paraburkholderia youngii]|uniref:hypothetical protein n=1 Tax=Paraburkholderia youngii TaxID=2782701 RepID=UPI003D228170
MNAERDADHDELTLHASAPATGLSQQRIRRRPPSKRSVVNEFQARALALLIDHLEKAALHLFEAPSRERLPLERHEEFFALPEYQLFVEGAYACGFVCTDFAPGGPTVERGERVEEVVGYWSFFELRHHVHTLLRSERWADGYSSPIFQSLALGALTAIGQRLANDDKLYEPY